MSPAIHKLWHHKNVPPTNYCHINFGGQNGVSHDFGNGIPSWKSGNFNMYRESNSAQLCRVIFQISGSSSEHHQMKTVAGSAYKITVTSISVNRMMCHTDEFPHRNFRKSKKSNFCRESDSAQLLCRDTKLPLHQFRWSGWCATRMDFHTEISEKPRNSTSVENRIMHNFFVGWYSKISDRVRSIHKRKHIARMVRHTPEQFI